MVGGGGGVVGVRCEGGGGLVAGGTCVRSKRVRGN